MPFSLFCSFRRFVETKRKKGIKISILPYPEKKNFASDIVRWLVRFGFSCLAWPDLPAPLATNASEQARLPRIIMMMMMVEMVVVG